LETSQRKLQTCACWPTTMQLLIYSASLLVTILTLILTIYSLQAPTWIRFDTPSSSPFQFSSIYGLTQKCDKSNLHPEFQCRPFPQLDRDCQAKSSDASGFTQHQYDVYNRTLDRPNHTRRARVAPLGGGSVILEDQIQGDGGTRSGFGFCEKWNTAAYTAQLSGVIGIINIFSTFLILIGNKYRQEHGWKICAGLVSIHALFQSLAWILIIAVFNEDDRFYFGSRLSTSTYVSIVTSVIDLVFLTALLAAGFTGIFTSSTERDEYERIQWPLLLPFFFWIFLLPNFYVSTTFISCTKCGVSFFFSFFDGQTLVNLYAPLVGLDLSRWKTPMYSCCVLVSSSRIDHIKSHTLLLFFLLSEQQCCLSSRVFKIGFWTQFCIKS